MLSSTLSPAAVPPVTIAALRRNSRRAITCASSCAARSLSRLSIVSPLGWENVRAREPDGSSAVASDASRDAPGGTRFAGLALRIQLALVPAVESQPRDAREEREDEHARRRDQEDRGEHAGNLELIAGFEDAEGQSRLRTARARHELRDDRADEGQAAADAQATEEIGQGCREAEMAQRLPPRGAVKAEQVDEVPVRAGEAEDRVGQHGEEGDEPGADEERQRNPLHPENDERGNRDERCHLKDDCVGKERA